jgi:hypothetical protein
MGKIFIDKVLHFVFKTNLESCYITILGRLTFYAKNAEQLTLDTCHSMLISFVLTSR